LGACFYNPVRIVWGPGITDSISNIITDSNLGVRGILVLTGRKSLEKSGKLGVLLNQFKKTEIFLYNDIPSNPEISELYNIKAETDKLNYDSIIAIGGGSVLDMGKCLAAFKGMHIDKYNELELSIINKDYQNYDIDIPVVAIPTTAGTGSEVTSWATIWDKKKCKKYSVEDERLYPGLAIIDPMLTMSLPLGLTASTALDALSHALEAYWSKRSNEIVRIYAQKSIELIIKNLNNLLDDLNNLDLRTKIAQGSLYAGLAFSNTKTTACHCISYPLTAKYNIPHGIAVSMTLAQFLNINREFIMDKRKLLCALGIENIKEAEGVINNIFIKSQIPFKLSDYGVKKEDIGNIIENSFIPDRMDNNPVKITKELLKRVLEDIY